MKRWVVSAVPGCWPGAKNWQSWIVDVRGRVAVGDILSGWVDKYDNVYYRRHFRKPEDEAAFRLQGVRQERIGRERYLCQVVEKA